MADLRFVGLFGAFGVMFGAFGAHVLEGRVSPERLQTWETASRYHLVMAVALLVLVTLPQVPRRAVQAIAAGTLVFAGSLYLLVLLDQPWLGAVTPLGGLLLIGGWASLGFVARTPRVGG